jgi:hypothetical protein
MVNKMQQKVTGGFYTVISLISAISPVRHLTAKYVATESHASSFLIL